VRSENGPTRSQCMNLIDNNVCPFTKETGQRNTHCKLSIRISLLFIRSPQDILTPLCVEGGELKFKVEILSQSI